MHGAGKVKLINTLSAAYDQPEEQGRKRSREH